MNLLEIGLDKLRAVLGTDLDSGLTGEQVLRNRKEFGENILFEKKNSVSDLAKKIFGDAIMALFLMISFFDYLNSGNFSSLVVLLFVVLLYAAIVMGTHWYVSDTKKKLEPYSRARYHVRRSGRVRTVQKSELVPGDILLLEKGDVMPCDGIILRQSALKILEASVTGRRVPVFKRNHDEVENEESGLPYFDCILFAGSVVLHGSAKVFVCNTGENIFDNKNFSVSRQNTAVPHIYELAMELKKQIYLIWVLTCFLLFALGVFRGLAVFDTFWYATAIIVAAFPDSVEHLCDLAVSYMSRKLFLRGVILRNPGAVDRLCDVNCVFVHSGDYLFYSHPVAETYVLGDKKFHFRETPEKSQALLENLLLAQSSKKYFSGKAEEWQGEKAILAAAAKIGIQKRALLREFLHINSYDYDPHYGYSCTMVLKGNTYRLVIRGNLNSVLACCDRMRTEYRDVSLTPALRSSIRSEAGFLAGTCERMFAVAILELSSPSTGDQRSLCRHMTYLGLFALSTPISAAAANAVNICQKSGIRTHLLTDDFPETVASVSKSVSIIGPEDYQYALSYQSYERIDRGVFVADLERYKAFCGFTAEEKQNIIKYHKDNGNITMALTGGLYDTLPQMEADISVVGTEEKLNAVRLNADLLFRRKNFELIPLCINWARIFYRNIVRVMQYVLLNQVGLGMAVFLSLIMTSGLPFHHTAMLISCLAAVFPSATNVFRRHPTPRLEDNTEVLLEDRVASLRALSIIPFLAGMVQAISVMLSRQIALYASGREEVAASAALVTLIFSCWWNSLSMKFDSPLSGHLRDIGRSEWITLINCILITYLTTASPLTLLWQSETGSLGFWPLAFAVLLSLFPMAMLEWIKWLKKDEPVSGRVS